MTQEQINVLEECIRRGITPEQKLAEFRQAQQELMAYLFTEPQLLDSTHI